MADSPGQSVAHQSVAGQPLALDARGYLLDASQWQPALAESMARQDAITLTAGHWEVIYFLREYFEQFALAPPMRLLVREIGARFGPDKASSRYLYRLFPDGPARQACRYAGLPKPVSCI
jgi:tRNA 2-thiouridine synthesizing protein E